MLKTLLYGLAIIGLTGCSAAMKPEQFIGREPRLVLEDYFKGQTKAWGMFHDRFGRLRREFVVDINGKWDGKILTLDEEFDYADGEKARRVWTIRKINDNTYEGTADDVIGIAHGRTFGNALNWIYDLNLKVGDRTWKVKFDDWMLLEPGGVMLNHASVSKWGIKLGTVTLFFSQISSEDIN